MQVVGRLGRFPRRRIFGAEQAEADALGVDAAVVELVGEQDGGLEIGDRRAGGNDYQVAGLADLEGLLGGVRGRVDDQQVGTDLEGQGGLLDRGAGRRRNVAELGLTAGCGPVRGRGLFQVHVCDMDRCAGHGGVLLGEQAAQRRLAGAAFLRCKSDNHGAAVSLS